MECEPRRKPLGFTRLLCHCLLLTAATADPVAKQSREPAKIVFVCDNGTEASLIAVAYFNKLEKERGLPDRAIFRGIKPSAKLAPRIIEGLERDGIAVPDVRPQSLEADDISWATAIVVLGSALPIALEGLGKVSSWTDLAGGDDYDKLRDSILKRVEELVAQLQRQ